MPIICPANGAIAVVLRLGSLDSKIDFDDIKIAILMWYKPKERK